MGMREVGGEVEKHRKKYSLLFPFSLPSLKLGHIKEKSKIRENPVRLQSSPLDTLNVFSSHRLFLNITLSPF